MYISLVRSGVLLMMFSGGMVLAQSERLEEGREAYEAHCAECHDSGKLDAPASTREQDWEKRSQLWEGVLFEHAKQGYLKMPAGGGVDDISDYDLEAAAEYMLTRSHPELPHD